VVSSIQNARYTVAKNATGRWREEMAFDSKKVVDSLNRGFPDG